MWNYENGKIKLDIGKVRDGFKKVQEGDLTLIFPDKGSFFEYTEDEKKLRSVIVDKDGFILSSAWPKFGNWGEFKEDTNKLEQELKNGIVRFSHKEDGSLCIRSVINGNVIFRTRGTMFGGYAQDGTLSFKERFYKIAEQKYPILLDPTWMADRSLLFEYVSPDNVIVIRYKEEDLIFIGYVLHKNLSIGEWEVVSNIAKNNNFNLVKLYELPRDPILLIEEIKNWREEGVVVRCCNDQVFVKVKSSWYLTNHRIKSNMNYNSILELIERENLFGNLNEEDFISALKHLGFDWEIIESSKEYFKIYVELYEYVQSVIAVAKKSYEEFISQNIIWSSESEKRKEFAKVAISLGNPYTQMAFNIYSNNENGINKLTKKIVYGGKYDEA